MCVLPAPRQAPPPSTQQEKSLSRKEQSDPSSTALVIKSSMSTEAGQCDNRMTPGDLQPSPTCAVVMRSRGAGWKPVVFKHVD